MAQRQGREQMRDRIAEQQAEGGHHDAHHQGAPPQGHVDPALLVLPDDVLVGVVAPVDGVPVVAQGVVVLHGPQGPPILHVAPALVGVDHGLLVGRALDLLEFAARLLDQTAPARFLVVHPRAGAAQGQLVGRGDVEEHGLVQGLGRQLLTVPLHEGLKGSRQGLVDRLVVDAAQQEIADGDNENQQEKKKRRQHENGRPHLVAAQRPLKADFERCAVRRDQRLINRVGRRHVLASNLCPDVRLVGRGLERRLRPGHLRPDRAPDWLSYFKRMAGTTGPSKPYNARQSRRRCPPTNRHRRTPCAAEPPRGSACAA